jgi:hypothetical protein
MRIILAVAVGLALAGCSKTESSNVMDDAGTGPGRESRYVGIGIYSPDDLWTQQIDNAAEAGNGTNTTDEALNRQMAVLDDDSQIIAVIDSKTGEIRQCGNMSGRCTTTNPWGKAAPVLLKKHAADLRAEAEKAMKAHPTK